MTVCFAALPKNTIISQAKRSKLGFSTSPALRAVETTASLKKVFTTSKAHMDSSILTEFNSQDGQGSRQKVGLTPQITLSQSNEENQSCVCLATCAGPITIARGPKLSWKPSNPELPPNDVSSV